MGDQDKPVLLVEGYKDGTRTPVPPIGSNRQQVKSVIKIAANGSVSGDIEVFLKGISAVQARSWARNISKETQDDLVKNLYRQQGMIGSGKLEKDDPKELADSYHYKASFSAEKFIKLPGAGAFYIHPPLNVSAPIYGFLQTAIEPEAVDVTCASINATEEYTIELPKAVKVLSIPDNLKIANDLVSYVATYKLKGNVLTVKRTLDDRTKGNVCKPQIFVEYKKLAEKAIDNLKEQVLYK
jgi:hypothetical protein